MNIDLLDYLSKHITSRKGENKELHCNIYQNLLVLRAKRCRKVIYLNRNIALSADDFVGIGLYLAEGYTSKKHSGELGFANSESISINLFLNLLEKLGIKRDQFRWKIDVNINFEEYFNIGFTVVFWNKKCGLNPKFIRPKFVTWKGQVGSKVPKTSSKNGCVIIAYGSVVLRGFFLYFINKLFDDAIRTRDKEKLALILKGYFAGDGHVNYSNRRKQVEFLCNDRVLRNKLREALTILGALHIRETDPINTKTHTHSLRFYNRKDFLLLNKYEILHLIDYKRNTFLELLNQYSD